MTAHTFPIFHCSPGKITSIESTTQKGNAIFQGTLFFSEEPFETGEPCRYIYTITVTDSDFIDTESLVPTSSEIAEGIEVFAKEGVQVSAAQLEFLTRKYVFDYEHMSDELYDSWGIKWADKVEETLEEMGWWKAGWWLQGFQARVARRMGYLGCRSFDDTGVVFMIDMAGRLELLGQPLPIDSKWYGYVIMGRDPELVKEDYGESVREAWWYDPAIDNPALALRSNPYNQTDDEGYLINPNDGGVFWWHWSDSKIDEFIYRSERQYTFIASTRQILNYMVGTARHGGNTYLYQVRIAPKKGVYVLERDDVFGKLSLPLKRQLESMKRTYGFEDDLRYMTYAYGMMAQSEYPDLFRHFSTFSCMREPFKSVLEKQNRGSATQDIFEFNISAYLEGFEAVQAFFFRDLRDDDVSSLDTRIPHLLESMGFHGWFERESFGADINIGIDLRYYDVTIISEEKIDTTWDLGNMRKNPYNQTDDEGYLINPNDGTNLWYHFLTKDTDDPRSFEFQMGNFSGSPSDFNETYFAGHPAPYRGMFGWYKNYLTVKIRIGKDCNIFDARDLFREIPEWVLADITRAFNEMDDVYEPGHIFDGEEEDGSVSQRTQDYLYNGDLGKTLNLWRQNEVHYYKSVQFSDGSIKLERMTEKWMKERGTSWGEWFVQLWMLDYGVVHHVLSNPNTFPIFDPELTHNLVGWLERENCDALDPEWNNISVAIAHNDGGGSAGYLYLPCLDETKIEIVSRVRKGR